MDTKEEREACIAAYVDQLVVQNILSKELELVTKNDGSLDCTISLDPKTGMLSVKEVKASNPYFEKAVREEVAKILPIVKDRKWRKIKTTTDLSISLQFPMEGFQFKNELLEELPDPVVAFSVIEQVPKFVGCEGENNIELKECMSKMILQHTMRSFNTEIANTLGLDNGRARISIMFVINNYGYVVDASAKAPHPALEREAEETIKSLPRFTPGRQEDKTVSVSYALPIIFQVSGQPENKSKDN